MSTPTSMRPAVRRLLKPTWARSNPPAFLIPSLRLSISQPQQQQSSPFSTTPSPCYPRDMNRQRGVSTVRRTGPRQPLSVSKTPLPVPDLEARKKVQVECDPEHGLYGFFHSKEKPMNTPEEDFEHGRAWTVEELRGKSWEDLHALWWECCRERNRILTEREERLRLKAGLGGEESRGREKVVRATQMAIKQALTERFYQWREAEELAKKDAEIDLSGNGPAYIPGNFVEDVAAEGGEKQDEKPSA